MTEVAGANFVVPRRLCYRLAEAVRGNYVGHDITGTGSSCRDERSNRTSVDSWMLNQQSSAVKDEDVQGE